MLGPVRALTRAEAEACCVPNSVKTFWKRVRQPVVCDRPGRQLFARSLGDALFGVYLHCVVQDPLVFAHRHLIDGGLAMYVVANLVDSSIVLV